MFASALHQLVQEYFRPQHRLRATGETTFEATPFRCQTFSAARDGIQLINAELPGRYSHNPVKRFQSSSTGTRCKYHRHGTGRTAQLPTSTPSSLRAIMPRRFVHMHLGCRCLPVYSTSSTAIAMRHRAGSVTYPDVNVAESA